MAPSAEDRFFALTARSWGQSSRSAQGRTDPFAARFGNRRSWAQGYRSAFGSLLTESFRSEQFPFAGRPVFAGSRSHAHKRSAEKLASAALAACATVIGSQTEGAAVGSGRAWSFDHVH